MTIEIKVQVGPIKGTYKKQGDIPTIIMPCQHLVIIKEKILRKDRLTVVHGQANGENKISKNIAGESK